MRNINEKLRKLTGSIESDLSKLLDKRFTTFLAKKAQEIIYKRVKSGYGVSKNGEDKQKLEKLSKSYVDFRKGKVKFFTSKLGHVYPVKGEFKSPVTGQFGTPTKSNLTLTGQMLDAIEYKINQRGFSLSISDDVRDDGKKNSEVAKHCEDNGRQFFSLTLDERQILIREIEKELRKILRNK